MRYHRFGPVNSVTSVHCKFVRGIQRRTVAYLKANEARRIWAEAVVTYSGHEPHISMVERGKNHKISSTI